MGAIVRGALVIVGIVLMLLGVLLVLPLGGGLQLAGLQLVAIGGFLVIVVAIERQRYRSQAAERSNAPPGPGGGETPDTIIDPRFRPTSEAFVDPTTGHRMRVFIDPASGERRYIAES